MGNRGAVTIRRGRDVGHAYSHWEGCFTAFLAKDVLSAALTLLAASPDGRAAAAYVYRSFIENCWGEPEFDTPAGLDHLRVELDFDTRRVLFIDEYKDREQGGRTVKEWSFDAFVALSDRALDRAYHQGGKMLASGWKELEQVRARGNRMEFHISWRDEAKKEGALIGLGPNRSRRRAADVLWMPTLDDQRAGFPLTPPAAQLERSEPARRSPSRRRRSSSAGPARSARTRAPASGSAPSR